MTVVFEFLYELGMAFCNSLNSFALLELPEKYEPVGQEIIEEEKRNKNFL
jgi:hypothetical protein